MNDDAQVRTRLRAALAALESLDWGWSLSAMKELEWTETADELVTDPWTAITIGRAAFLAPFEVLKELQILLYDGEDDTLLKTDAERVPTIIAEKLFDAAERRFRLMDRDGQWSEIPRYAELLLELPGACDKREQVLLDLFAGLIDRANAVSREITREKRRPPRMVETEQFAVVWNVLGLTAHSSGYDISTSLVIGLLRGADLPILRACDAAMAFGLWADLVAVWELRQKHNLPAPVEDWLHRTICQDEPDEHAASELEEP